MRKYYTRPCNFYYGNYAKDLIDQKKAYSLAGRTDISFDQVEILERKKKSITESKIFNISEIKSLNKELYLSIKNDLKKITRKRKKIKGINFNTPQIMGVLNITPDSFSDGGLFYDEVKAKKQIKNMINGGASIIDIGGESTRPGSKTLNAKEEWKRIKKTIIKFKKNFPKKILSLDTRKSYVMKQGINYNVDIINDVSGLRFDKKSFSIVNNKKNPFILHHMQGTPNTMQTKPTYNDVLLDIFDFFESKITFFEKKGFKRDFIIIDPGIGFGKNLDHNLRLLSKISIFHCLGTPVLIGPSRKRFIEHIVTKFDTPDRTGGTLSAVLYGLSQGVQLFRIHNVKEINQGILVFNKILNKN
jgi:dihydropteroate synthase